MLKLYLDTSVYGGYFDEEFKEFTEPLFQKIFENEFKIMTSDLTEREIENAPDKVQELYYSVTNTMHIDNNNDDDRIVALARKYIRAGVVGKTSTADCAHIAAATIYEANFLISWNFKHIVNVVRIIGYNEVNQQEGCKTLSIRSPQEFINSYEN